MLPPLPIGELLPARSGVERWRWSGTSSMKNSKLTQHLPAACLAFPGRVGWMVLPGREGGRAVRNCPVFRVRGKAAFPCLSGGSVSRAASFPLAFGLNPPPPSRTSWTVFLFLSLSLSVALPIEWHYLNTKNEAAQQKKNLPMMWSPICHRAKASPNVLECR